MHTCRMTALEYLVVAAVFSTFGFYEGYQAREKRREGMSWSDIIRPHSQTRRDIALGVIGLAAIYGFFWWLGS